MGESKFSSEILSELIEQTKQKISEIESNKLEQAEVEVLKKYLPEWRDVFENTTTAKKKMMLSTIVKNIDVKKDGIRIDFKLRISQFIGVMGMASSSNEVNKDKVITHRKVAANE